MRSMLVFFCALCAQTVSLFAVTTVTTPPAPVTIIPAGDRVHILCQRWDPNFNQVQDEGDAPASWVILNAATQEKLAEMVFPWANVNTARVGFTAPKNALFIGVGDSVLRYDATTQQFIGVVYEGSNSAVSCTVDGEAIIVSKRPDFTNPGTIQVILVSNGNTTPALQAGVNVQQTLQFSTSQGKGGLLAVSEGGFGRNNGKLDVWVQESQTQLLHTELLLGDTPQYALVAGDTVFVVMHGTHQIKIVDLNDVAVVDSIPVPEWPYNGPREAAFYNGRLFVSSFTNLVYDIDIATKSVLRTIDIGARSEGIAIIGNNVWVTRTYDTTSTFGKQNEVYIFPINPSSVHEITFQPTAAKPNPASSMVELTGFSANAMVVSATGEQFNITNRILYVGNGSIAISLHGLARGFYTVYENGIAVNLVITE